MVGRRSGYIEYQPALFGDKTRLLSSRNASGELSRVNTTGNGIPVINNPYYDDRICLTIRIYRGTSPGVYDKYVDLGEVAFDCISDCGYFLNTGEKWINRPAGPMDIINPHTTFQSVEYTSSKTVIAYGTDIPIAGLWKKGDKIINSNPAVGLQKGWICTADGSPGTWVSEGIL